MRCGADRVAGFFTEYIRAASYEGTETTGEVRILGGADLYRNLEGRDVIVVEDIIDTGTTLSRLLPLLRREAGPRFVEVCALLTKRLGDSRISRCAARYVGFSIPDEFVVGYGLDHNELYRDLGDVWVLSERGIIGDGERR